MINGMIRFRNLLLVVSVAALFPAIGHGNDPGPDLRHLDHLVLQYFASEGVATRNAIASSIEMVSGGSVSTVIQSMRRAIAWPSISERSGVFTLRCCGEPVVVRWFLPEDYDPSRSHPALVCFPDAGHSPARTLELARHRLGDAIRGFVLFVPERPIADSFCRGHASAGAFATLIRTLRRRVHLDTDRLFLFGIGTGGDAAWLAAMFHPGDVAGVITLESYPHVPYAGQTYGFLLQNLRRVEILTAWSVLEKENMSLRHLAVVAHNTAIQRVAAESALPISGLEVSVDLLESSSFPGRDAQTILSVRRPPPARNPSLWFRYPSQGRIDWLRQSGFAGDVWNASEFSILPSAGVDRTAFIAKAVQDKLAYISGHIEGQSIKIVARRCKRLELLFPGGLIDFDLPVVVYCNGKIRFDGRVRPEIRTLLETAHDGWDFQRPVLAKLSFTVRGRAPR